MEQIDSSQIHLWLAFTDEITDPWLLDEYRGLLSQEELQQQARFRLEGDRHRYLVTRAMVRTALSKYAEVAPREWRFVRNAYGKPSIAAQHASARGIEFNVSHTRGLVVMGIAHHRAIGVDVENMCAREINAGIADRYFAQAEVAALRALPREQQQLRFFEFWTLKESYIKARGMGLAIGLDSFAFDLVSPLRISLTADTNPTDGERWTFRLVRLRNGHLVALCAQQCGTEWPEPTFRLIPFPRSSPVLQGPEPALARRSGGSA